jgi:NDP-sugar pyrophosphorylase family protein
MPASELAGVTAAVLAGGLGTRLRSVVADRPKVLAPVAGQPFLAHLLDQLGRVGVRETGLLVGYGAGQVREAFGDTHSGMRLEYSTETEPLGTGGAVRLALPHLRTDTVLLLNGDSYCDLDLAAFLRFHRERGASASLALTHVENASRFGRVVTGPGDRVERFEEKNPTPAPGWINAGVYLLARPLIEAIPSGRAVSLERDLMPAWVAAGAVFGFPGGGRFIDIGVPESFAAAQEFFCGL